MALCSSMITEAVCQLDRECFHVTSMGSHFHQWKIILLIWVWVTMLRDPAHGDDCIIKRIIQDSSPCGCPCPHIPAQDSVQLWVTCLNSSLRRQSWCWSLRKANTDALLHQLQNFCCHFGGRWRKTSKCSTEYGIWNILSTKFYKTSVLPKKKKKEYKNSIYSIKYCI